MENELYGVIAYAMQYWFLGLMIVALCAAVNVMRRTRRSPRDSSALPDAGMIGESALLREDGSAAALLPAPQDGVIGESHLCDVRVPGLPRFAASYSLERDGVHLRPVAGCGLLVEGQPVRRKAVLRHGRCCASANARCSCGFSRACCSRAKRPNTPWTQENRCNMAKKATRKRARLRLQMKRPLDWLLWASLLFRVPPARCSFSKADRPIGSPRR